MRRTTDMPHRTGPAVAAVIAVATAIAGCGGASGPPGTSGLKALDINPLPRAQVKDGGVLRWAVDEFPTQWNLNQIDGSLQTAADVLYAMLPTPFLTDEKAALRVNPDYVTAAKVTARTPHQVITYTLNRSARWSDGKPITWRDYAAQWRALRSSTGPYLVAASTGYEDITGVVMGRDAHQVVVTFGKPFAEWQQLFGPLYPESANSTPKAFNSAWKNRIPITAGPFKPGSIDKTSKIVTIVRDPAWWGRRAKLDSIAYRTLDDSAIVNAFANGEVDYGDIGPDASGYKRALGVSGGAVREAGGPDFRHFTLNATSPLLSDVRVRRAVGMALDRAVIARADLTGLNWPARALDNHFLVNTQTGYRDNAGSLGRYSPAGAGKLLDAAGWKLSGGVRMKAGKTLTLRFVIPSGTPISKQEGEIAQGMLQKVGIKIDLRTVPGDSFFDSYVIPGNFDITPFSWIGTPFPVSSGEAIYVNPTKDAKGQLQVQENFARIGSARIDALMRRAAATLDVTKALELVNQADALVWQEGHSLPLYQRPEITAVKASLANLGAFGFKTAAFEDIGYAK